MIRKAVLLLSGVLPFVANAQLFYNQQRDETAQKALSLAESVSNGAVFQKQLANLERMNRHSQDRVFAGAEVQMRTNLLTLSSWSSVKALVDRVGGSISRSQAAIPKGEFDRLQQAAATQVQNAKADLEALKKRVTGDPNGHAAVREIGEILAKIGKLDELTDILNSVAVKVGVTSQVPQAYADVANEVFATAASLGTLYKSFTITAPKPAEIVAMEAHLAALELEESHQSTLAAITARRDRDVGDILNGIEELRNELADIRSNQGVDDVAQSLAAMASAARTPGPKQNESGRKLGIMVHTLYGAAALAARDDTPVRLAKLRIVSEGRAFAIRQSAAAASEYEDTVLNGAQRLALYHKGGLKAQTVAQIVSALSTLGLIPTVLSK